MRRYGLFLAIGASALLATACGDPEPTQITLTLTTDLDCAALGMVTIALITDDAANVVATTSQCENGRIGTLVFVPDEAPVPSDAGPGSAPPLEDKLFRIRVVAGVQVPESECESNGFQGCIVARRSLHFTSDTATESKIHLSSACVSVACSPSTTCDQGECVPDTKD